MNQGGYPAGAEYDKSAPYNQPDNPKRAFDVTITEVLSRNVRVKTDDYIPEEGWDDDFGKYGVCNTEDTDWVKAYKDEHETIENLLKEFINLIDIRIQDILNSEEIYKGTERYIKRLEYLKEECRNWCVEECEVVE